jgi:iron complex outermembrane recepter protein
MKHLPLLLIIFLLLLCSNIQAQNSLQGEIKDKSTGEAIVGSSVYITELKKGAVSHTDGTYKITNLPAGTFTVEVRNLSYQSVIKKINISGLVTINFVLEISAMQMNEVVVTGASATTQIKESPVPIAIMSRLQWLQGSSTNLVDAVGKLPGMSQISTGVGLSKPIIRGLGFNRVITMHDGIRQEDNQWGEEHAIQIDEYSVDRYEIIRGAGSLMYGSDGLGGVMSLLSPRQPEEGKIIGNILTNYQTNNNMMGISGMLTGNQKGFVWRGRVSHKNADNYRNKYDGRVFGSNYNETDYNGMIGLSKNWGYSHLYFSSFNQNINIINGTRDAYGNFTKTIRLNDSTEAVIPVSSAELTNRDMNQDSYQKLSNLKISSNNYVHLGNSSLSFNIGYSQNHRREYVNVFKPGIPTLYFFLQTTFYDVRYNLPKFKEWETTVGSNGMYQTMQNRGDESLYPNLNLIDNGLFVFTKKKFDKLTMSGGVRADRRQLAIEKLYVDASGRFQTTPEGSVEERFEGFSKTFSNVTGSIGAVYAVNDNLSIKTNLARGFRAPTVSEISSNGEHAGTFRYEIGNKNQKSEISFQSDIGLTLENRNIFLDIAIFQNRIQNYSYSEKVLNSSGGDSIVNPSVSSVPTFKYTQGNAQLLGGELVLTVNPEHMRWFSFTNAYSVVRAKNLSAKNDSAKYLPFMPAPRLLSSVKFTRQKLTKHLTNLYVLVEFEYHQPQNQVLLAYNTETTTPDYGLLNLSVGTDVVNASHNTLFSLYLTAQNITDIAYQNHQNRLKYLDRNEITGRQGVYNIGRNVSLKLTVPVNIRSYAHHL